MHSDPHYSSVPGVGVHTKMLDVLQFLLGLVVTVVREMLDVLAFGLQTHITSHKHVVCCTSMVC
jgi:hypothetical protein